MANIRPLRAWRYNEHLLKNIDQLTSPLFDVISPKQREVLYKNELNSIHLSVPAGAEPIENAGETLKNWKNSGVLVQDQLPGIYVYYQYFSLPGSEHERVRKGFISNLLLHDWEDNIVLRHENTMPYSVNDRRDLLAETELNVSPTHGLYTDPEKEIENYLDESMKAPLYETEDYQGVRDVFSVIHDAKIIKRIIEIIKGKQIILADGHHRYEGSLAYKKLMSSKNPNHKGDEAYNYHMMYFTNTESDNLRILPTHRVINGIKSLNESDLLNKLSEDFIIKPIENPGDVNEVILGKKWAFGLLIGENAYKIRLNPEKISELNWNIPDVIKELDLTVLHYFVIEKVLGIPGKEQRDARELRFEPNFSECLREVIKEEAQMAFITKGISIDTIKKVCYSGYTLPQKSTYFYPKVISGFLFSSINEDEFYSGFDSSF